MKKGRKGNLGKNTIWEGGRKGEAGYHRSCDLCPLRKQQKRGKPGRLKDGGKMV